MQEHCFQMISLPHPPERAFGAVGRLKICFFRDAGREASAPLKKHYKKVRRKVGVPHGHFLRAH